MRYLAILVTLALAAALAVHPAAHADTTTLNLNGFQWVDTGFNVAPGGRLQFQASAGFPEGVNSRNVNAAVPLANLCSLIAEIGDADPFYAGPGYNGTVRDDGRLYLNINGASFTRCSPMTITVLYVPPSPPDSSPASAAAPTASTTAQSRPTPPPTPPQAPVNFRIAANSAGSITVAWDAPSSGVSVYAANGCGCFTDAADGATSLAVASLPAGSYQCFIAYSHNAGGNSGWSAWACDTVQ